MLRTTALIVPALLSALVLAAGSGCRPPGAPPPVVQAETADSLTTAAGGEQIVPAEQVSLRVPSMHCPFACWPKVQETLEEQPGVAEVTLAEQARENELDNPVVHVRADSRFDAEQAIEALAKAGFGGATVEN